jgi:hypothetical protein
MENDGNPEAGSSAGRRRRVREDRFDASVKIRIRADVPWVLRRACLSIDDRLPSRARDTDGQRPERAARDVPNVSSLAFDREFHRCASVASRWRLTVK